jgi:hypothetical protein
MIILNIIKNGNPYELKLIDINKSITTNEYYKEIWKEKYNVLFNKNKPFSKQLVKYLKGDMRYIE